MVATFRTNTRNFALVICLNWLPKIELRGPVPSDCQYYCLVLLYACTLVREDAKRN